MRDWTFADWSLFVLLGPPVWIFAGILGQQAGIWWYRQLKKEEQNG